MCFSIPRSQCTLYQNQPGLGMAVRAIVLSSGVKLRSSANSRSSGDRVSRNFSQEASSTQAEGWEDGKGEESLADAKVGGRRVFWTYLCIKCSTRGGAESSKGRGVIRGGVSSLSPSSSSSLAIKPSSSISEPSPSSSAASTSASKSRKSRASRRRLWVYFGANDSVRLEVSFSGTDILYLLELGRRGHLNRKSWLALHFD